MKHLLLIMILVFTTSCTLNNCDKTYYKDLSDKIESYIEINQEKVTEFVNKQKRDGIDVNPFIRIDYHSDSIYDYYRLMYDTDIFFLDDYVIDYFNVEDVLCVVRYNTFDYYVEDEIDSFFEKKKELMEMVYPPKYVEKQGVSINVNEVIVDCHECFQSWELKIKK